MRPLLVLVYFFGSDFGVLEAAKIKNACLRLSRLRANAC